VSPGSVHAVLASEGPGVPAELHCYVRPESRRHTTGMHARIDKKQDFFYYSFYITLDANSVFFYFKYIGTSCMIQHA
jgi:hypothetical protein